MGVGPKWRPANYGATEIGEGLVIDQVGQSQVASLETKPLTQAGWSRLDAGRFVATDLNWAHVFRTIQCGFERSGTATFGEGQSAGERVLECRCRVSLDGKEILLRRF